MRLYTWECPRCETLHREVNGAVVGPGELTVKCPTCGAVDRIFRTAPPKEVGSL